MVLLNIAGEKSSLINPAFSRFHPRLNVLYTCTEDIEENGQIIAYEIKPDGELKKMGAVDAGGTSTCYVSFVIFLSYFALCTYFLILNSITYIPLPNLVDYRQKQKESISS